MRRSLASLGFVLAFAAGGCAAGVAAQYRVPAEEEAPFARPAVSPPMPGQRGLWIGPIRLCRDDVLAVRRIADPYLGHALVLSFAPAIQPQLGQLTSGMVGRPLAVRIDGRVVSEPHVNEPILGTELQISGPTDAETDAIEAAAKAAC
ncbi:MAG: hypothetical protein E6G94_04710 [Alphaproteobacteria bacterium]|nr:MAG: hypothetical protein E6G94_04710 [Alphaproteobacteria bacterium]